MTLTLLGMPAAGDGLEAWGCPARAVLGMPAAGDGLEAWGCPAPARLETPAADLGAWWSAKECLADS